MVNVYLSIWGKDRLVNFIRKTVRKQTSPIEGLN